jgi:Zn-dependent peptidase ImmA (M78 family)
MDGRWSQLDYEMLLELAERRGLRVLERALPDLLTGLYSESHRLILVESRILEEQQRVALAHELIHAERHDASCAAAPFSKIELATRREVAIRLVNPEAYRIAEETGGYAYQIACDLGVTVQCVRDYQRYLEECAENIGRRISA